MANRSLLPSPCKPEDQVTAGRTHYNWAEFEAIHLPLFHIRPRCLEPYVIRGTLHLLAEKTVNGIGWHPEYESLLAEKQEDSAA